MNVEPAREVFKTAFENVFAVIEQLQISDTAVCEAVKLSLQLQEAG